MLDIFNIPNNETNNVSIFYANGGAWQTWQKPRGCSYIWIMCVGGGGGGAGGTTSTSPGANALANGGGSGAITRALFNASFIPDNLYIQVGVGGTGGSAGANGGAGTKSYVSSLPTTATVANLYCVSGGAAAGGGDINGLAAAGETVAGTALANMLSLGAFISTAGIPAPAVAATVTNVTPLTNQIVSPGAPGGWINSSSGSTSGGTVLATSFSPVISGGTPGTTNMNGGDGYFSWNPFFSTGGAGGAGGSAGQTGGNGGNGGIGSGGGAAGMVFGGATAGRGGKGGDGLVVIIAF